MEVKTLKTDSNLDEVYKFLAKHKNQMATHQHKVDAKWNQQLRQFHGKYTSMLYEFEVGGNTCYHLLHGDHILYYFINVIVVPFAKDKYQYMYWHSEDRDIFKYTSHFFERYKERMNLKGSTKQAVKQFFKKSRSMACIYKNKGGQFVFAMDDGLVLGVEDERLNMRVGCTFVDYSLLKPSQRAAFDKVQTTTDDARKMHIELKDFGISHKDAGHVVSEKFESIRAIAEEIYSWYFEEGDLRERN